MQASPITPSVVGAVLRRALASARAGANPDSPSSGSSIRCLKARDRGQRAPMSDSATRQ